MFDYLCVTEIKKLKRAESEDQLLSHSTNGGREIINNFLIYQSRSNFAISCLQDFVHSNMKKKPISHPLNYFNSVWLDLDHAMDQFRIAHDGVLDRSYSPRPVKKTDSGRFLQRSTSKALKFPKHGLCKGPMPRYNS